MKKIIINKKGSNVMTITRLLGVFLAVFNFSTMINASGSFWEATECVNNIVRGIAMNEIMREQCVTNPYLVGVPIASGCIIVGTAVVAWNFPDVRNKLYEAAYTIAPQIKPVIKNLFDSKEEKKEFTTKGPQIEAESVEIKTADEGSKGIGVLVKTGHENTHVKAKDIKIEASKGGKAGGIIMGDVDF
jgi:hypothetical protein